MAKKSAIIVSDGKTQLLRRYTHIAAKQSRQVFDEIIVVESQVGVTYAVGKVIPAPKPFNYNRALNEGIKHTTGDYIALLNNDIQPTHRWINEIIHQMEANDLMSASPWCRNTHPGRGIEYNTGVRLGTLLFDNVAGWAIVIKRELLEIIGGKLPEVTNFWYSDDAYIEALRRHNIRHGLVTSARVDHHGCATLNTLGKKEKREFTHGQTKRFINRYGYKDPEQKNKYKDNYE